jgi:anti-anti-sigma regulatory factor
MDPSGGLGAGRRYRVEMRPNRYARSVKELGPGPSRHVSWRFVNRQDFRARANEYVASSLDWGHWIQYVGDAPHHQLRDELAALPAGERLMARGGWGVSPVDDFYNYRDGDRVVDPQRSVAARVEDIEQALTAGFAGLRIVADATAVVHRPEQADAFARYEYLLDQAMTALPASALCAHDRARVDRESAAGLACLHPVTGPDPTPFNLYAERGADFSLAGQLDVASRELMARTIARIESYLAGPQLVVNGGNLEFIDHRALLNLADLAQRIGADSLVLQTSLRSAKRISEVLGDDRITIEVAG